MSAAIRKITPRRHIEMHPWQPLTMTWPEVAASVFRTSEEWLHRHLPDDFPRPDPILNVFARAAVEKWVERRFGLDTTTRRTKDSGLIESIAPYGKTDRAVSG